MFEVEKDDSALNQFADVYFIDAKETINLTCFLYAVPKKIIKILSEIPSTKVKLFLFCNMSSKVNGVEKMKEMSFTSKTEENLVGTDKSALYYKMVEQVMKKYGYLAEGR